MDKNLSARESIVRLATHHQQKANTMSAEAFFSKLNEDQSLKDQFNEQMKSSKSKAEALANGVKAAEAAGFTCTTEEFDKAFAAAATKSKTGAPSSCDLDGASGGNG
ncbi:Nif11 family protein [bacterium AH-315-F18]|nr:Nif11 family protein [bacterium AH-315-F18]